MIGKLIWALMPFIFVCFGLLSIVIAAFLVSSSLGFLILGVALIMLAFIISPSTKTGWKEVIK